MNSPTVVPPKEPEKFPLEAITKAVTYSLPIVYVCGFVVLSLFEGDYGIADLSVVKVKALAAGLLFLFFIGYPSLISIRAFELLGLKIPGGTLVKIESKSNLAYFYVIKIFELYISSVLSSMVLIFFFAHRPRTWLLDGPTQEPSYFSMLTFSWLVMNLLVFFFGILIWSKWTVARHFGSKPARCVTLVVLVSVLWATWNFEMSDRVFFGVVGWFYLVGLASIAAATMIERKKDLKERAWEVQIMMAFVIFVPWFASSLYGTIKPAFGGASPVSAKLYLKEGNVVLKANPLDVEILEETEQGYYVLNKADSKSAVFIPRSTVSSAQFNPRKQ